MVCRIGALRERLVAFPTSQWRIAVSHSQSQHAWRLRALMAAVILTAIAWFAIGELVVRLWH